MVVEANVFGAVVAVATLLNSVVGLVTLYLMREVKHATNSLTDRLVATTRSDATQAGITQGRAIEKRSQV